MLVFPYCQLPNVCNIFIRDVLLYIVQVGASQMGAGWSSLYMEMEGTWDSREEWPDHVKISLERAACDISNLL